MNYRELEIKIPYKGEDLIVQGRLYPEVKSNNRLDPDERAEFNIDKIILNGIDAYYEYEDDYNEIEQLCLEKSL